MKIHDPDRQKETGRLRDRQRYMNTIIYNQAQFQTEPQ